MNRERENKLSGRNAPACASIGNNNYLKYTFTTVCAPLMLATRSSLTQNHTRAFTNSSAITTMTHTLVYAQRNTMATDQATHHAEDRYTSDLRARMAHSHRRRAQASCLLAKFTCYSRTRTRAQLRPTVAQALKLRSLRLAV